MKRYFISILLVWVPLAFMVPMASAQSDASKAINPEYLKARDKARVEFKAGRYLEAAQAFEQAFGYSTKGNLLYNIGFCYEKAGEIVTAVEFYQRFIDAMPGSKQRATVQGKIAALKKQIRFQKVSVSTSPTGATIYLDDKSKGALGRAPLNFDLVPGQYVILAELKGHEAKKEKVTVYEGRPAMIDLTLMASSEVGTIDFIVYERDAVVMIDGKNIGKSPIQEPIRLKAGMHTLNIVKPGFVTWTRKLNLKPGSKERLEIELVREQEGSLSGSSNDGSNLGPWILGGTGIAMGVASIGFGVVASGLYTQLEEKERRGELIASQDVDTGQTLVMTTNLLAGLSLAAVVGGVIWWVVDDPGVERSSSLEARVILDGSGGGSVGFGGQF